MTDEELPQAPEVVDEYTEEEIYELKDISEATKQALRETIGLPKEVRHREIPIQELERIFEEFDRAAQNLNNVFSIMVDAVDKSLEPLRVAMSVLKEDVRVVDPNQLVADFDTIMEGVMETEEAQAALVDDEPLDREP